MIHKARVMIETPGKRWALRMQANRREVLDKIKLGMPDMIDVVTLIESRLGCEPYDIAISSLSGESIDEGADLDYEFMAYSRGKIIIAVFLGEGKNPSRTRFAKLFPGRSRGAADDRAFLVVSPARGFQEGWALWPTGQDRHNEYGVEATPSYLKKLVSAAR